ncbi:transporter substrate-binding domain-containing protein [Pseudoxanthomonas sp. UTMC 1351]|uniref:ATP-binding protein n=1 Tax=Pseudoxanthomonas sp. UTMC 1351 TaxID=2695853 RepID=UPI0034CD7999
MAIISLLAVLPVHAQGNGRDLPLSSEQLEWLERHPTIVVGLYDTGWPPFESHENGQPAGLAYDYLNVLATHLGLQIRTRTFSSWSEMLQAACVGEIDVMMNLSLTAERTRCVVFTRQYVEVPVALVGRPHDSRLSADLDLEGLRVVTEKDFATGAAAHHRYPAAQHVIAGDTAEALRMVASGQADAYLGNAYVASTLLASQGMTRATLVRQSNLPLTTLHFGVPNAKQPLAEALDIALASMPEAQHRAIRATWLQPLHWASGDQLATSDAEWAVMTQSLRLGFAPDWAPISFLDENGLPSGLSAEYLKRFRAAGANLQRVPVASWQEIRDKMRSGDLDVVIGVPDEVGSPETGWVLSQPFLTAANVIVMRDDSGSVLDIRDLDGMQVALSDPERLGPLVLAQAPQARVVSVGDAAQALQLLSDGRIDAYIGNLAAVDRPLRQQYLGQLHIAAPTGIEDRLTLAVRQEYAPLATAFNRLLISMTPREREAIRGDWLAVEYHTGLQWRTVLKWAVPLLLVLLTAGLVHGIGYWRLRREVEERRRVERRLEEIAGNLPAVVYQAKWVGDGTVKFPFIIGDMPSLFGLDIEQAQRDGRNVFVRVHPDDQEGLAQAMQSAAAVFGPIDFQFRGLSARGWRWVRSCALPHRAKDGALLWSGYWIDVTEAHTQSEALEAAKAVAEQAAAAKAEFLATMSHEIRTPMSGVLGMLEVLAHTQLDDEQQRVLATIEDSAQMLRQILDDILDFSKIEAGALSLEYTPVNLRRIVDNVQQMLSIQATNKGLGIGNRIDPQVAPLHVSDGVRLRQILFNLLSNAIKFTGRGEVMITLTLLDEEDGRQWVQLSVADTGIGMSAEQQQRLFQPFSQAETSTTRRYGGTGLGLSICRRLVQMMDGELRMESVFGEGTRVDVLLVLPIAIQPDGGSDASGAIGTGEVSISAPAGWAGRRVLIVEDHPTNQALMLWRMKQLALNCDMAADGEAALVALRGAHYDLVITDCRMPGMDGYTLTQEIRRNESQSGGERLPVIALTASVLAEEAERCRAAGMDDFLAKPVTLAALRTAIARWLPLESPPAPSEDETDAKSSGEQFDEGGDGVVDRKALARRFGAATSYIVDSLIATTHKDLAGLDEAMEMANQGKACEQLHRIAGGVGVIGVKELAQNAAELIVSIKKDGTVAHAGSVRSFRLALVSFIERLADAP